jgi:sterol desaturase/sphingolipid hydroxylase (fatty acid hydroxylase superfamily)
MLFIENLVNRNNESYLPECRLVCSLAFDKKAGAKKGVSTMPERDAMRGTRSHVAILFGLAVIAFFGFIMACNDQATTSIASAKYHIEQACEPCYQVVRKLYLAVLAPKQMLSWHFYTLVGIILSLEWAQPVYTRSRAFSVTLFHDFLWFLLDALFVGILMPIYHRFLFGFHRSYLSFLQADMVDAWPLAGHILVAVLVADFIRWLHHLLRHKVMLFWYFHTVHHSQRDMNLFTDLRVHPVERLIEAGVSFIPFLSLRTDVALASFVGWYMFGTWYARFYHSNIKTNLGILRYIVVTPQSHRIHHSRKKEHQDKNFGAIFSIWDHLFGTQYRKYDEYPETGIDDATFPHETEFAPHRTLSILFFQLVYPFELAFRSATRMVARKQAV